MTLSQVLEALLFASPKPITLGELRAALKSAAEGGENLEAVHFAAAKDHEIANALDDLARLYREGGHAIELSETASGWRLVSAANCAQWVRQLFPESKPARLSAPALETMAIIAYRQPITRADIEGVRGVDAGGVVQTLVERGLVRIVGRAELPGRPLLYATSEFFLEHFGLKSLNELPAFDELRKTLFSAEANGNTQESEPAPEHEQQVFV